VKRVNIIGIDLENLRVVGYSFVVVRQFGEAIGSVVQGFYVV